MKTYTDLEQSKKLAKILPLESADMSYPYDRHLNKMYGDIPYVMGYKRFNEDTDFPCWSLAALIEVLPKGTNVSTPKPLNESSYCCWNQQEEIFADNPVDACVEMIIWLSENKKK